MKKILLLTSAMLELGFNLAAATFTADFNSGTAPSGSTVVGNATVTSTGGVGNSGVLRLTENTGGQFSAWIVSDFSGGSAVRDFTATFKVEMGPVAGADGISFNWATNLSSGAIGEEGDGTGLTVEFDTFDNGGGEAPAIDIKWQGVEIAHSAVPFDFSAANAAFVPIQITLTNGLVTVTWNGTTVRSNVGCPVSVLFQARSLVLADAPAESPSAITLTTFPSRLSWVPVRVD